MEFLESVPRGAKGVAAYRVGPDRYFILKEGGKSLWLFLMEDTRWSIAIAEREPFLTERQKGFLVFEKDDDREIQTAFDRADIKMIDALIYVKN